MGLTMASVNEAESQEWKSRASRAKVTTQALCALYQHPGASVYNLNQAPDIVVILTKRRQKAVYLGAAKVLYWTE